MKVFTFSLIVIAVVFTLGCTANIKTFEDLVTKEKKIYWKTIISHPLR